MDNEKIISSNDVIVPSRKEGIVSIKNDIPTCKILGVDIAAINMDWLLKFTIENIGKLSGEYMSVVNVYSNVTAYKNPDFCEVLNGSVLSIPDGGPLAIVGRHRGFKKMERTTGPSYMEDIFKISEDRGFSHYFYGSTPDTIEKIKNRLLGLYPKIKIAGMYSPPFHTLNDEENRTVIDQINESNPDFIWVGLGCPKQEMWMAEHKGLLNGFMVGVGAGFDYFAENIKRAPKWMQKHNLEWFYRLMQEPKRLFKKYFKTNIPFIWHAMIRGK